MGKRQLKSGTPAKDGGAAAPVEPKAKPGPKATGATSSAKTEPDGTAAKPGFFGCFGGSKPSTKAGASQAQGGQALSKTPTNQPGKQPATPPANAAMGPTTVQTSKPAR